MRPNLATLVDDFRRHGNATAIVTYRGNRRVVVSYGDLSSLASRFALELTRREIQKGERVILWGQNGAEWIGAFFGCVLRGVLVVPLDAAGSIEFAKRVIEETGPRLIVGDRALLAEVPVEIPQLALDDLNTELPVETGAAISKAALDPDTPLQILFTSGTTAEPKGVVHTHRNVLASVSPIETEMQKYLRYERFVHPLRFLHTLPLSHVFGQFMGLWLPVLLGAEVHFESRLQAQRLIEIIGRERISVLAAVPRVLDLLRSQLLLAFPGLKDELQKAQGESVWRRWWRFRKIHRLLGFKFWAFVCGGASLPVELEGFWNTLGFALIQGYGMTETTALITLNHPFKIGKGTIGKPLPGREIRITEDGEILVRGDMVSTSSWQNGRITQAPDAWLATGDLAKKDVEGQLQFLGRKGQMIVTSSGLNIHPEDVEEVLHAQDGVRASVVVPVAFAGGTEAMAVLLLQHAKEDATKIIQASNARLADYQRIRHWRLWPGLDFPRTSTGKIQRGKVAQWVNAHVADGDGTAPGEGGDPLLELIAGITRNRATNSSDTARLDEDLHLDSLGRVQLQSELEQRFGVVLEDAAWEQMETLGQLRQQVGMSQPAASLKTDVPPSLPAQAHAQDKYVYPRWPWSLPAGGLRAGV
jgi:long-chain acyl-CoA synthetase